MFNAINEFAKIEGLFIVKALTIILYDISVIMHAVTGIIKYIIAPSSTAP